MKALEAVDRRDFLKLNLFAYVQLLFYRAFGFASEHKTKECASLLDRLLELDFSDTVKDEITFRVALQKKYGFDQNGKPLPLDRFIFEQANFIICKGSLRDVALFEKEAKPDASYMFIRASYYGAVDKLDFFMQKLLGSDNKIFAKAALAALDNKSIESFSRLMMHKSRMDERTLDRIYEILSSDRYAPETKRLQNLLPDLRSKQKLSVKPKFSAIYQLEEMSERPKSHAEEILIEAAKECLGYLLQILKTKGDVEFFEIFIELRKVRAKLISATYKIDFMSSLNNMLSTYVPQRLLSLLEENDILSIECE